jgi:hypothetical protein
VLNAGVFHTRRRPSLRGRIHPTGVHFQVELPRAHDDDHDSLHAGQTGNRSVQTCKRTTNDPYSISDLDRASSERVLHDGAHSTLEMPF